MVDENLTDEQQAEMIRQWFRENGMFILGGIGLGLLSLFGWDWWQSSRLGNAEQVSNAYEELVGKIEVNDQAAADSLLQQLVAEYGDSPYIDLARLRLARLSLDRNDFAAAGDYLEAVATGAENREIRQIGALRLARVRLQQEEYDAALAALNEVDTGSAFFPRANDIRGDVYQARGDLQKALDAYDAALSDSRQPATIDQAYVTAKRESLSALLAANDATLPAPDGVADTE